VAWMCGFGYVSGCIEEKGGGKGRAGADLDNRIVSMTYGRPTMTAHLHGLNLPSTLELDDEEEEQEQEQGETNGRSLGQEIPSKICFYVEYIRQCRILGEILNSIYHSSSHGGPNPGDDSFRSHGLDAILELDAKLSRYEDELNPIMSWRTPSDISGLSEGRRNIIVTQRAVLHGSFLYLRLMLHRPILTQLCSTTESKSSQERNSPIKAGFGGANRILYTSFAAECAKICLGAAMDLIDLVHSTYQTNNTGGWWWDALCMTPPSAARWAPTYLPFVENGFTDIDVRCIHRRPSSYRGVSLAFLAGFARPTPSREVLDDVPGNPGPLCLVQHLGAQVP